MELTDILKQIDSLKKEAEKLQPVKPELEKAFWDKFRLEFNYNSNHIEGNTLTYGHTQLLLLFDQVSGDYSLRELEEMKAHDVAMKMVKDAALDPDHMLTEKFIKEINETILVRPYYKEAITPDGQPTRRLIEPGTYKKYPNSVRLENGEIFNYSTPEETAAQMGDLIEWYRKEAESKELHPVQIAALFHYRFVCIHPFDDGNGRTSRLLMNYVLMKNGFAPMAIESVDKKNYLLALNRADTGEIDIFIKYISIFSLKWQEKYYNALKGEKIDDPDDFEKEIEILKRNIGNERKIKTKFSNIIAIQVFEDYFFALIKKCVEKISKFDSFFYEKEIYFTFPNVRVLIQHIYKIKEILLEQRDGIAIGTSLEIELKHKGFKTKNNRVFNYSSILQIYFAEYSYRINLGTNHDLLKEKFYNEPLTIAEMEEIALKLAKLELEEIKRIQNI